MKRNYPLRKLDRRECRKSGIPTMKIFTLHKLDCPPDTVILIRSKIKRIGHRNVLLLGFFPMKNQILPSESPDRILFQGRQDYVSLDFTANREGKFQNSALFNMDSRLLSSENYAFFSPEDAERILSFCRGLPGRTPLYRLDSLQQQIRIARSQWKQQKEQKKSARI